MGFFFWLRNSVNKKTFQLGYHKAEIGGIGYGRVTLKASKNGRMKFNEVENNNISTIKKNIYIWKVINKE